MDSRLSKWLRWLKEVHDDIQQLLVKRNIFWEVQDIIKNNKEIHKPSSFYGYLGDTYVAYISIGIRRQVKVDKQSISFARLLTELSPKLLRSYPVSTMLVFTKVPGWRTTPTETSTDSVGMTKAVYLQIWCSPTSMS